MSNVVRTCRRTWRRLGVPRRAIAELSAELEADLAAARAEGVDETSYVGGDTRGFAGEWAAARGLVRPRPQIAGTALAAVLGALPGAALAGFVAYGIGSPAFGGVLGLPQSCIDASCTSYASNTVELPEWTLLVLYIVAGVFACAGAVAAVAGLLAWRGDPAARPTFRALVRVVPLAALVAVLTAALLGWLRDFPAGDQDWNAIQLLTAVAVFAGAVAITRWRVMCRQGRVVAGR